MWQFEVVRKIEEGGLSEAQWEGRVLRQWCEAKPMF